MGDDAAMTREFRVTTLHGTQLAADPASGTLRHGPAGAAVTGHMLGQQVILLARADGGRLAYPGQEATSALLPLMLIPQNGHVDVALRVPGGHVLTAIPGGAVEADRSAVGGWERFQLKPDRITEPASAPPVPSAVPDALWADAAVDSGLVAGLLAEQPAGRLRQVMPVVAQRPDYCHVFPFARTVLSEGAERSSWHTRAHLRTGIQAYGWVVGDHTYGAPTVVDGQYGTVEIGRYCSIAGEVRIVAANHRTNTVTTYPFAALSAFWPSAPPEAADHAGRGVVIGNSVWIGAGATILPGARIGDGAIVGAMAVVAGTIPPFTVAVGNPARITRRRFDDATVARLLAVRWWDWPDHRVDRAIPLLLGSDIEAFLTMAERNS